MKKIFQRISLLSFFIALILILNLLYYGIFSDGFGYLSKGILTEKQLASSSTLKIVKYSLASFIFALLSYLLPSPHQVWQNYTKNNSTCYMGKNPISIVMLGATGAVGTQALHSILKIPQLNRLTTLGRRTLPNISNDKLKQFEINIFKPESYIDKLAGHQVAVCTLGVGQPSKISKEDFVKIDKMAVLDFARACKSKGVQHFELLSSVGIDAESSSFYLRIKGELEQELKALKFERLSIFKPSMILTPKNRYGMAQAILLKVWPLLSPFLIGSLKKFRGVKVEDLGKAFAKNILKKDIGAEALFWKDFKSLSQDE